MQNTQHVVIGSITTCIRTYQRTPQTKKSSQHAHEKRLVIATITTHAQVLKGVFDGRAIVSGEKTDDWREESPYWDSRLQGREYDLAFDYHGNVFDDSLAWVLVEYLGAEKVEV
jgi:hypothetical protein